MAAFLSGSRRAQRATTESSAKPVGFKRNLYLKGGSRVREKGWWWGGGGSGDGAGAGGRGVSQSIIHKALFPY